VTGVFKNKKFCRWQHGIRAEGKILSNFLKCCKNEKTSLTVSGFVLLHRVKVTVAGAFLIVADSYRLLWFSVEAVLRNIKCAFTAEKKRLLRRWSCTGYHGTAHAAEHMHHFFNGISIFISKKIHIFVGQSAKISINRRPKANASVSATSR